MRRGRRGRKNEGENRESDMEGHPVVYSIFGGRNCQDDELDGRRALSIPGRFHCKIRKREVRD